MDDETFYEAVALELERDGPRKGLWAKAFAKTGGNDNAAKAYYIELRVAELKEDVARRTEEERQQRARQAAADAEIERQRREEAAPWLEIARKMRILGMGEDQIRENLTGRGLTVSVAAYVAGQVFHGEKVHDEAKQPMDSTNTTEPPDGARERYISPSPNTGQISAMWNPNAAANWSLVFTPAFGSYLHMLNWRALGEPERAASAQAWFYVSLGMLAVYVLMGIFMADAKASDAAARGLGFLYLVVWYFGAGRSQGKHVKTKYGSDYPRRSWGKPLLIGVAAIVAYFVAALIVGAIIGVAGRA